MSHATDSTLDNASVDSEKLEILVTTYKTTQSNQQEASSARSAQEMTTLEAWCPTTKGRENHLRLTRRRRSIRPLEQPYDIKIETHPDPHTDYNEADPWKYPIDLESGLRLVEWVDGDKHNPKHLQS